MRSRERWPADAFRSWMSGMLALVVLASTCGLASAQQPARSAADAPAEWQEFSMRLKAECEKGLQADDKTAQRLQAALAELEESSQDKAPLRVAVSIWIDGVGTIARVSFKPLPTEQATADLKTLLLRAMPGPPPSDMLQPVRLMLSLKPPKKAT